MASTETVSASVTSTPTSRCCICSRAYQPCINCKCARKNEPCVNCIPGDACCNPTSIPAPTASLHDRDHNGLCPDHDPVNRNFTWGETDGDSIVSQVTAAYEQVVHMRKNLFMPPTGNVTKQFINEMTRLINEWNHDTPLGDISLKALMIMPALLLQKPSATSKSRDHTEALKRRMGKWKDGDIQYLLAETHAIQ